MLRTIGSVITATLAAVVIFTLAEQGIHALYPSPTGLDFNNKAATEAYMNTRPFAAYLLVLAGWIVGAFVAGLFVRRISTQAGMLLPLVVGGILTVSAVLNFYMLPHPVWFVIVGVLVFVPSVLLGHSIGATSSRQITRE